MKLQREEVRVAVTGGLLAQIIFEVYAWFVSPIIFGPILEPSNLVKGLILKYMGVSVPYQAAFALHALIGIIGFGLFTLLIFKVLNCRAILSGFASGLILWFVAQGILAPILGREFMMGFGTYTQSSFVAHVGMTIIIALFLNSRLKVVDTPKSKSSSKTT